FALGGGGWGVHAISGNVKDEVARGFFGAWAGNWWTWAPFILFGAPMLVAFVAAILTWSSKGATFVGPETTLNKMRWNLFGTVLKTENTNDAPLQLTIFKIEKPSIQSATYAVLGEIKYDNVQGSGYLEMWNYFPPLAPGLPEGQYFSRTLGMDGSGPMSRISGTSSWRPFSLPFDRTETTNLPTRLEINIFLPGRGVVWLGPPRLMP